MTTAREKVPPVLLSADELVDAYTSPLDLKDVELPGGVTVRVRALTKRQQMHLAKIDPEKDVEKFQREMFRMGLMTGDATLSDDQIERILDTWPAGAFDAVLNGIMEVSGQEDTFRQGDEDRNGAGG
jgi:hypothetical protein